MMRNVICLAALLTTFTAAAQVGTVDHDWCLHAAGHRYGALQVTYPGWTSNNNTYTYLYFGRSDYRVHAPAPLLLAAALLLPLTAAGLALARKGSTGRSRDLH